VSDAEIPDLDPTSERLWNLYGVVMEEYRFQVSLNWQRAQYLLVVNLGIVGLGTGLIVIDSSTARFLTGILFSVGIVVAVASARAVTLHHSYYRVTRETKTEIEEKLNLGHIAPRPTSGMRGEERGSRWAVWNWNVNDLTRALLVLLAVVDAIASFAVFRTI
jgi:hypothetical protein